MPSSSKHPSNHARVPPRNLHIDTSLATIGSRSVRPDGRAQVQVRTQAQTQTQTQTETQTQTRANVDATNRFAVPPSPPGSSTKRHHRSAAPRPTGTTIPRAAHHPDESFLESQTPVDADMADQHAARAQPPRDSHDLSFSPRDATRDSLVANMLLSLDQMPTAEAKVPQYDDDDDESPRFFDIPRSRSDNQATTLGQAHTHHANGNGRPSHHQYSYSSDLDAGADESSRFSSREYSRDGHSSSSAVVQDAGAHLNNAREAMQWARSDTSRNSHARGRVGSKSSSIGSAEGVHALAANAQRRGRAFSRPASIDATPPQVHQTQPNLFPLSPSVPAQYSNSFLADDFDAAPTPTVHGGPRREGDAPLSRPPTQPAEMPLLERKRSSSRSVKSSSGRNKAVASREPAPPLPTPPAFALESAPAPNVGYGKSKEMAQASPKAAPAPAKEQRPGFFKRFFGGGSSSQNSSPEPSRASRGSTADRSINEPNKMQQAVASPSKVSSAPPSRDNTSAHSNHPALQKKSSFFRRRKKSIHEEPPPVPSLSDVPPVPSVSPIKLFSDVEKQVPAAEPSPVSSLRQVMNPYLRDDPSSPATPVKPVLTDVTNYTPNQPTDNWRDTYKREFSPEYEPSPNAVIRKVHSNSEPSPALSTPSKTGTPRSIEKKEKKKENSFLDLDGGSDNDEEQLRLQVSVSSKATEDEEKKDDTIRAKKKGSTKRPAIDIQDSPSQSTLALPLEGVKSNESSSAPSTSHGTPGLRIDTSMADSSNPKVLGTLKSMTGKPLDEPDFVVGEPTEDERQKAQKIFDGNEEFIQQEKAAAWMGEEGPIRQRTLQAYMELYDFTDLSVVHSLRQVCGRLVFRAETQQVDRILVAFSKRWCRCNPNHGFKATDVIHTICYSIMLLNTDLHMADIEQKMTRSQFVKNTMGTITQAVEESVPNAFDRPSILAEKGSTLAAEGLSSATPSEQERKSFRNSFLPPSRTDSVSRSSPAAIDECGPLVKAPYNGSKKGWDEQVEIVLKGIYNSIREERLPLFGADPAKTLPSAASQNSLSVRSMLKRTPSMLSKAPSESQLSLRGRIPETNRGTNSRWTSKSRSRPGMGRNGFNSSRTSFDDDHSVWSPASSSAAWSRQSLGRTQTSVSQDSFGSAMPRGDYQQSIGFANALSQAIIRQEDMNLDHAPSVMSADFSSTQLLEDESLELAGPPWVKEGMVIHKHHLDGVDRKAKERNWTEVFAVVQKGQMSLFSFTSSKSARQKSRTRATLAPKAPVGGGNWQDNATSLGTFNLRQTLASALPSPGYSRTRPHVWALSLPTGAVHLFQVGTADIIKEFVTTANYWSARLSTHPLVGGISNIEYGWSDAIVNNALVTAINETGVPAANGRTSRSGSVTANHGRKSSVSSFRSASIDQAAAAFTHVSGRGKLPGDRINIAEWAPPSQSLRPSNLSEAEQLKTLSSYVKGVEDELQSHNQLRSPMLLAFTPRGHNAGKAMANWERKSAYLLREIVKFRTYVDCLQQAETRKQQIYTERALAQRAARGELTDGDMELSGEEEADETLRP